MKYFLFLLAAAAAMFTACHHSGQPADPPRPDSVTNSNPFFPVADYLESQILNMDSTPTALLKKVMYKGRMDSSFISVAEFNNLALQFLPPEIRDGGLDRNFTETSFSDRTTRSTTFTYSPKDGKSAVQRIDVLTRPGVRAQEVKSIYVEESRSSGDSLILRKMLWRSTIGFQIVTLTRVKGQEPDEKLVKVAWGSEGQDE